MAKTVFIRLAEVINKKQEKRVMSVTVKPTVTNCSGTIWFTDHIYPKSDMAAGSVSLHQGVGGQRVVFPNALHAEDDLALLASVRECTRNGITEPKEGFYQYSAAWDSKHRVNLETGKSARVLFELQQMTDGGDAI